MKGMIEDLQNYPLHEIEKGFVEWRRSSPKIPTIADIKNIIDANMRWDRRMAELAKPNERSPDVNDFKNLTDDEKTNLDSFIAQTLKNLRYSAGHRAAVDS